MREASLAVAVLVVNALCVAWQCAGQSGVQTRADRSDTPRPPPVGLAREESTETCSHREVQRYLRDGSKHKACTSCSDTPTQIKNANVAPLP